MSSLKHITLTACALVAYLSLSTAHADQIVMKDGDRITGEIVKKDGETVTFKSKNFGTIDVKWDDIATVTTEQPVNVVLRDDRTVKATIQTENDRIQVTAPGVQQTVPPSDIVALRNEAEQQVYERFLNPGLLDLWTITGSLNLAGTIGNAETSTLTTPLNFERASNTSRTKAYFNSIAATATVDGVEEQTARAIRGGWAYSRDVTKKLFANAFNDYEYDKFQSLDLRIVLGGGLGYHVWTREFSRFDLVGGAAWNRETFSPGIAPDFTRNSAEAYWGNDLNHRLNTRMNLVQSFRMFNNLSNTGEYRVNFDIGSVAELTRWLTWNITLSDRYLSNPVPGRKNNDFLYTTGLGFKFSR
jgi:hypothetical protein